MSAKTATAKTIATKTTTGLAATAAQVAQTVVAAPVAAIKKPAIAYANGVSNGAPANAPVVAFGGQPFSGTLPPTNPANRGVVGSVSNKVPGTLVVGNGKGPRVGHNLTMWGAVQVALATGPQSATALANAAGSGGAAFVAYCVRNGWLAASK